MGLRGHRHSSVAKPFLEICVSNLDTVLYVGHEHFKKLEQCQRGVIRLGKEMEAMSSQD